MKRISALPALLILLAATSCSAGYVDHATKGREYLGEDRNNEAVVELATAVAACRDLGDRCPRQTLSDLNFDLSSAYAKLGDAKHAVHYLRESYIAWRSGENGERLIRGLRRMGQEGEAKEWEEELRGKGVVTVHVKDSDAGRESPDWQPSDYWMARPGAVSNPQLPTSAPSQPQQAPQPASPAPPQNQALRSAPDRPDRLRAILVEATIETGLGIAGSLTLRSTSGSTVASSRPSTSCDATAYIQLSR